MLPLVIKERDFSSFKFWFDSSVQDGMYYRSELFYRLRTEPIEQRAWLYCLACKMARSEQLIVTASDKTCSIWISLRSPNIVNLRPQKQQEPPCAGQILG